MKPTTFGVLADGREVQQYVLENDAGMTMKVITYGATITSLSVPGRDGSSQDVVDVSANVSALALVGGFVQLGEFP